MRNEDRARNLIKLVALRFHKEFSKIGRLPNSERNVYIDAVRLPPRC